jgi:bisanhydrobacterioruberin hydratase
MMNQSTSFQTYIRSRQGVSIFLLLLFHLSAMIGISIGYADWFMSKTPLNLVLAFVLLLLCFSERPLRFWVAVLIFFIGGMLLEWVGVHYGFLFGTYQYGANLGPKLDGIPYVIGVNWALLTLNTGLIATSLVNQSSSLERSKLSHKIISVVIGAALMVFLDVFLEFAAPVFDFWAFEGGLAPLQNYVAWFGFAFIFQLIYQSLDVRGDTTFAWHLYLVQVLFFAYVYIYYYAL